MTLSRTIVGPVLLLLVAGCGSQPLYDLPLPGGAGVGSHPTTVHVEFDDVLDLVPQSAVKVDGVPVGRVEKIGLAPDGWTADVTVLVNDSVRLPANASAEVKQTNLLGEKFIELKRPLEAAAGQLTSGATIPVTRTRHAVDVEQVLGALSLLLNGGGVAQLQPIVSELNKTLGGREPQVRTLLREATTLITGLEKQVVDIQSALDGLGALGTRTAGQTAQIAKVLDELPAGVKVLEEQRPALIAMLAQLQRLGENGYAVIGSAKQNLIRDLQALRPTLQELGKSAPDLITSLPLIPTYPFPDTALAGTFGGQVNTFLSVDLQIGTTLNNLGAYRPNPVYIPPVGRPVPVNPRNPYYNGNGAAPFPVAAVLPVPPPAPGPVAAGNPLEDLLKKFSGGIR